MRPANLLAACLAFSCLGRLPVLTGQTGPGVVSPQSLVGDWEWVINGPTKAILHMSLDVSGSLTGTVAMPGVPKPVELSNIHLAGRALTYTMSPMPAITEQISADGNSIAGIQPWQRIRTVAIPARQLAGNWEFVGPKKYVLRLRSGGNGELTGKLDEISLNSSRQLLTAIRLDGNKFSYKMADGKIFQGELSNEGTTIIGRIAGDTMLWSWTRVETEPHALIADSKERASPTDGVWSGIVRTDDVKAPIKPANNVAHVTLYLKSNPTDCAFDFPEIGPAKHAPCVISLQGNHVHIMALFAVFDGTLTGDKLSGTWTMAKEYAWGPLSLDLTRSSQPVQ